MHFRGQLSTARGLRHEVAVDAQDGERRLQVVEHLGPRIAEGVPVAPVVSLDSVAFDVSGLETRAGAFDRKASSTPRAAAAGHTKRRARDRVAAAVGAGDRTTRRARPAYVPTRRKRPPSREITVSTATKTTRSGKRSLAIPPVLARATSVRARGTRRRSGAAKSPRRPVPREVARRAPNTSAAAASPARAGTSAGGAAPDASRTRRDRDRKAGPKRPAPAAALSGGRPSRPTSERARAFPAQCTYAHPTRMRPSARGTALTRRIATQCGSPLCRCRISPSIRSGVFSLFVMKEIPPYEMSCTCLVYTSGAADANENV